MGEETRGDQEHEADGHIPYAVWSVNRKLADYLGFSVSE